MKPPSSLGTQGKAANSSITRLRVRLTAAAETIVRGGHPWVFAGSIRALNREGTAGELAVIYDRNDQFLAIGLFDPESPLRIRVLHAGQPVQINDVWWASRLERTLAKRAGLLDEQTTACRLINGESDGWPGLVLDRYGAVWVMKLYTVAWLPRVPMLVELLRKTAPPDTLVLRLSRNVQAGFAKAGFADGQTIQGAAISGPVVFLESDIRFEADVIHGQKTGFFLDQRENRREVEKLARDAEVLNAFSFTGGFSLYAARGGARTVTDLDISAHALAGAERNFALNRQHEAVARCQHTTIQANAFEWLEGNGERMFDLIVLDPPSLAKRETERERAIRAYEKLVFDALRHLRAPGVLVAASCSAHVSAAEFFAAVERGATKGRRKFAVIKSTRHAPDHAATFPEAEYLKCVFLRCE